MSVDPKYFTSAVATGGGRDGKTSLSDGTLSLQLVVPRELGGPGGDGANPEKLFALGYSACFLGALRIGAQKSGTKIPDGSSVEATIGMGPRSEGGYGITAELLVKLPGLDKATAEELVAATHGICPYSNAIKQSVSLKSIVEV
ncbi:organic hydroperoxide resistance protein [Rhizobium sp.]|uniref:organic hydroperoxide resistance protein n=1 Tax=Rhizobium sp. TaxID=391 RepID=UPI000DD7DCE9